MGNIEMWDIYYSEIIVFLCATMEAVAERSVAIGALDQIFHDWRITLFLGW